MGHYLVCYDLDDPLTYPDVADLLEKWNAARLIESVWGVSTELSPLELRAALKSAFGRDDALAVIELRKDSWWACENAEPEGLAWLRQTILA